MRRQAITLAALMLPVVLAGCSGGAPNSASINVNEVLERTVKTLVSFDAYLRRYDYKQVDAAMFGQFNKTIQNDLNVPAFHPTKIATRLAKDASIMGYGDLNKNGKVDAQEPKLFKIELDTDNDRIIITSAAHGNATGRTMGRSGGFFAGVMIGSLMNRQTNAGIQRGHFDKRSVANAPIGKKVASSGSRARGRARSGGMRAGK